MVNSSKIKLLGTSSTKNGNFSSVENVENPSKIRKNRKILTVRCVLRRSSLNSVYL